MTLLGLNELIWSYKPVCWTQDVSYTYRMYLIQNLIDTGSNGNFLWASVRLRLISECAFTWWPCYLLSYDIENIRDMLDSMLHFHPCKCPKTVFHHKFYWSDSKSQYLLYTRIVLVNILFAWLLISTTFYLYAYLHNLCCHCVINYSYTSFCG